MLICYLLPVDIYTIEESVMLKSNIQVKTYKGDVASVQVERNFVDKKMLVRFTAPTQFESLAQIEDTIEILREARDDIRSDIKRDDQAPKRVGGDDSNA